MHVHLMMIITKGPRRFEKKFGERFSSPGMDFLLGKRLSGFHARTSSEF
jgi:hypothetical protein